MPFNSTNPTRISQVFFSAAILACAALGALLRIDQIDSQVLVGDEWHLIHRLTYHRLSESLLTFGYADYGIPLAVLFTPIMEWYGLSETTLRLPMLLAGVASIIFIPLAFRDRIDDRVLIVFALLLAVSPFLLSYSRIARTYALTLFGTYFAFWFLQRSLRGGSMRGGAAFGYATVSALVVWAHPITGPVLVTPFLFFFWQRFRAHGPSWQSIFVLGSATCVFMLAFVVPPLLHDMQALSKKAGVDSIEWETFVGAAHFWFGTYSIWIVSACAVLTLVGIRSVWRQSEMARWVLMGSALTVLLLAISRPWWVNMPLAFARYLLPLLPIVLLATAAGFVIVFDVLIRKIGLAQNAIASFAVATLLIVLWWPTSPHVEGLRSPNSYSQDAWFQLDYRPKANVVRAGLETAIISTWWSALSDAPHNSLTVAVAPFHYATFDWPAARWERTSRQRVVPAYLWGTCVPTRHGETPPDDRFRFKNAAHAIYGKAGMAERGVDYFVYQFNQTPNEINPLLPQCETWVRERFGKPDFEDKTILVWKLR
jgi:hypothetical protein